MGFPTMLFLLIKTHGALLLHGPWNCREWTATCRNTSGDIQTSSSFGTSSGHLAVLVSKGSMSGWLRLEALLSTGPHWMNDSTAVCISTTVGFAHIFRSWSCWLEEGKKHDKTLLAWKFASFKRNRDHETDSWPDAALCYKWCDFRYYTNRQRENVNVFLKCIMIHCGNFHFSDASAFMYLCLPLVICQLLHLNWRKCLKCWAANVPWWSSNSSLKRCYLVPTPL